MKFLDPAFEVPIFTKSNEKIILKHRLLFWMDIAEIDSKEKKIVLIKKGIFSKIRNEGSLNDALIRIHNEDMGGPSRNTRFGYGATLILNNERFLLTKQYAIEYVDEYVQNLKQKIGYNLKTERLI